MSDYGTTPWAMWVIMAAVFGAFAVLAWLVTPREK